jgi:hypothetical protein
MTFCVLNTTSILRKYTRGSDEVCAMVAQDYPLLVTCFECSTTSFLGVTDRARRPRSQTASFEPMRSLHVSRTVEMRR